MKRLVQLGPLLFASVLVMLSVIQYDFMRGLGWDPIHAPTFDWPSGLALGKYGFVMTTTFIVSGRLVSALGLRLKADLAERSRNYLRPAGTSQIGSNLLAFSGLALAGLAFTTDPTIRTTPATWHGILHDLSFVLLGLALFPGMIVLGFAFRGNERWRNFSLYTWLTLAFAIPAFVLKGAAFYAFLLLILLWCEMIAIRVK